MKWSGLDYGCSCCSCNETTQAVSCFQLANLLPMLPGAQNPQHIIPSTRDAEGIRWPLGLGLKTIQNGWLWHDCVGQSTKNVMLSHNSYTDAIWCPGIGLAIATTTPRPILHRSNDPRKGMVDGITSWLISLGVSAEITDCWFSP